MSTSTDGSRELPGPPNPHGINMRAAGSTDFDVLYKDYVGTPHYDDAKSVYESPSLNKPGTRGVNTWHEQVLAGRISIADLKQLGYTNLAKQRELTKEILVALTRESQPISIPTMRSILRAASKSLHLGRDGYKTQPSQAFRYVYMLAQFMPLEELEKTRFHTSLYQSIVLQLAMDLRFKDREKAIAVIKYADSFFAALSEMTLRNAVYSENTYTALYKHDQFISLMEAGITPQHAAECLTQGLSIERALLSIDTPSSIAEGIL